MTSQTTPQSSPTSDGPSRMEKKKALEMKLQMKRLALANMQDRIFSTQLEIMELQSKKETHLPKRDSGNSTARGGVLEVSAREVLEISDSGSEWSFEEEEESSDDQIKLSC